MSVKNIDHIVYCVPDLDSGIETFQMLTGAMVYPGGRHLDHGTRNAIVRIGEKSYFEIIAIDHDNKTLHGDRWMGIDYISDQSRITRWAIQKKVDSKNLNYLSQFDKSLGTQLSGSRLKPDGQILKWNMSAPLPAPMINSCPFLIDWGLNSHPVDGLPLECQMKNIKIHSVNPQKLNAMLSKLGIVIPVENSQHDRIEVTLDTPFGVMTFT